MRFTPRPSLRPGTVPEKRRQLCDYGMPMGRLGVGLMGPFVVTCDERPIEVGGTMRRAVLAMLALCPGETVSTERLIDGLWGDDPPESARNIIHRYISRWRGAIADAGSDATVASRPTGYALEIAPEQVDVAQFDRLVESGRRAMAEERHGVAVHTFQQAAALVRSEVLAEFVDLPFQRSEAKRLLALREELAADRMDCLLALGQGGELVAELHSLVGRYPYQERFPAQLMHALYRCGRQVDATRVYTQAREALAEMGFEPGPTLRAMEQAVLRQDPGLDSRSSPFSPTPPPVPLTSLIGRREDVERIVSVARETSERLITLIGPGGVGKTRLGIEVASRIIEEGWSPVAYVALSEVADPAVVSASINGGFGVPESWKERPVREIAKLLGSAPLLLVIDGVEHVQDTVRELIRELLEQGPRLRVLVTSRVPVGLTGERQLPVPPLAARLSGAGGSPKEAPAVALFIDRCERMDDEASFTESEVEAIARICERVDGLPLGIELAAARARTFGVVGLLERLGARLDLLSAPGRRGGGRHESLRHVIEWSYGLLDPAAQRLLARLSVFAGGFTVTQIEEMWHDHESISLLTDFAELDSSSLLARIPGASPRRFRMLGTVADFARERLDSHGETPDAHERLLAWIRAGVQHSGGRIGAGVIQFEPLELDSDNARAAVAWALENASPDDATDLCTSLYVWWMYQGRRSEVGIWLRNCLRKEGLAKPLRAHALLYVGRIEEQVAHFTESSRCLREAATIYRALGDSEGLAGTLATMAEISAYQGDFGGARRELGEAVALASSAENVELRCRVLSAAQWVSTLEGDHVVAEEVGTSLLREAKNSGWSDLEAKTLGLLAQNDRTAGRRDQALERLERAALIARSAQNNDALEFVLGQLAVTFGSLGRRRESLESAYACLACFDDGESDPWALLRSAIAVGYFADLDGDSQNLEATLRLMEALLESYPALESGIGDPALAEPLRRRLESHRSLTPVKYGEVEVFRLAQALRERLAELLGEPDTHRSM